MMRLWSSAFQLANSRRLYSDQTAYIADRATLSFPALAQPLGCLIPVKKETYMSHMAAIYGLPYMGHNIVAYMSRMVSEWSPYMATYTHIWWPGPGPIRQVYWAYMGRMRRPYGAYMNPLIWDARPIYEVFMPHIWGIYAPYMRHICPIYGSCVYHVHW